MPSKPGIKKQTTTAKSSAKPGAKSTPKPSVKSSSKSALNPKVTSVSVGDKAPAFHLPDENGELVSLKSFSGKALVLYFYPKDSTPGCTQESCDFRDNLNRLTSSGAAVVGLSADSVASHKKFKTKYDLNFPLLSDPDHQALEAYGVWQEKSLYGRAFMGIVRSTFVIDDKGVVRAVFPKVSVKGHVEEVLAAVKALKTSKTGSKGAIA
jgi:peroxiredoxin Q/BCP